MGVSLPVFHKTKEEKEQTIHLFVYPAPPPH